MSGRRQPSRQAKRPSVDEVMGNVLDELISLRTKVAALEEKAARGDSTQGVWPQPIANNSSPQPSTQQAPPVSEVVASGQPVRCSTLPTAAVAGGDSVQGVWPQPLHQMTNAPAIATNFCPPPVTQQATPILTPVPDLLASGQPVPLSTLPTATIVPDAIRKDILKGKDVNLAVLLLPLRERRYVNASTRNITVGDDIITLKPLKDARLTKNLTCEEFVKAFTIFKSVMCQQYPLRGRELDIYMSNIIDIATKFPGFAFYEYHLEFSAQAAEQLERGYRVDWGVLDERRLTMIVAGRKANACTLCNAFDHATGFCHLAADRATTPATTNPASRGVQFPCKLFNTYKGCHFGEKCKFKHICATCKISGHRSFDAGCPQQAKPKPQHNA